MPRKKKIDDFNVTDINSGEEAFVVKDTSSSRTDESKEIFSVDEETTKWLEQAMKSYEIDKKQSSAYLNEKGSYNSPTIEELGKLAEGPQDNLEKILRINSIVSKYANIDDIIGLVVDAIRVNLNTSYQLAYPEIEGRNKNKKAERAREIIEDFNDEIMLRRLIREQIPRAYMEGTVIMYLRKNESSWNIDTYPLGVTSISPYSIAGDPIVLFDVIELKSRLQKSGYRTKSGKNLFFDTLEAEILANYPEEVNSASKAKEQYAKLDIKYTGVMRVGNHGRRYGLSPIFRALGNSIILETFGKSDMVNAKARSKKIVVQLLDPVLLGQFGEKNPLVQQTFSHKEILAAYKQPGSCLYSAPAYVKDVKILEPKGEMVGKDTILHYLHKEMSSLGIGFLSIDDNSSVSGASISLEQLMRNINSISESLEDVLQKFYRQVLIDEGLPPEYAPTIKIIDSEAMEFDLRVKLATLLYSTLNCSLETSLKTLGIDFQEEINRRTAEEEKGLSKIFKAREGQFTKSKTSEDKENGRPKGKENDKQSYDDEYNKEARPK